MLCNARADEEPAVRSAADGELGRKGVALFDQELGRAGKVVEDVLFVGELAGLVPLFAVLTAAAQTRHRVNAAHLHPHDRRHPEPRRQGDVETAIAIQVRRVLAVELDALFRGDKRGIRVPSLLGAKTCLVSKSSGSKATTGLRNTLLVPLASS